MTSLCRLIYLKRGTPPTFKRKSTSNRKPTARPGHPISFKLRVFQQYPPKADGPNWNSERAKAVNPEPAKTLSLWPPHWWLGLLTDGGGFGAS
jgi:hypothetical protein